MPISGLDVVRLIREQAYFLIFTTAYPEYALEAFKVDADGYLVKPFYVEDFGKAVNSVLEHNRLRAIAPLSLP